MGGTSSYMVSIATSAKESDETKGGMRLDLEVGGTERVSYEEEGGTALLEMVVPVSLSDLVEPSNLALISAEASKSTKAASGMVARRATTRGSSTMCSTRMGFS